MTLLPRHAILMAIVSAVASAAFVTAQTNGTPELFRALGINMSDSRGVIGHPFNLTIYVDRWATPREFALFISTLRGGGTEGVLKMLHGREQIGVLRTTQPLGFPLSLAVATSQPDGGRRVVIISPRRIYEKDPNNPSVEYPLMVIDMTLPADHAGEGTIAQLARLSIGSDGDRFTVENFDGAKMLLKSITAAAQSHAPKSQ